MTAAQPSRAAPCSRGSHSRTPPGNMSGFDRRRVVPLLGRACIYFRTHNERFIPAQGSFLPLTVPGRARRRIPYCHTWIIADSSRRFSIPRIRQVMNVRPKQLSDVKRRLGDKPASISLARVHRKPYGKQTQIRLIKVVSARRENRSEIGLTTASEP